MDNAATLGRKRFVSNCHESNCHGKTRCRVNIRQPECKGKHHLEFHREGDLDGPDSKDGNEHQKTLGRDVEGGDQLPAKELFRLLAGGSSIFLLLLRVNRKAVPAVDIERWCCP